MTRWWVEKIFRGSLLIPKEPILPGRWQPKKDTEKWIANYYPDPGYINYRIKLDENSKKDKP